MVSSADDSASLTHQSALLAELATANAEAEDHRKQYRLLRANNTAAHERLLAAESAIEAATRVLDLAREDLRYSQMDLESIQERCAGADIIKASVEAKIEFVQERLQLYTRQPDVLSPVSCLPGEIIIQIFDSLGTNRATNAVLLSHVNRRWRNLALNTASIWTTLDSYYGPGAAHTFAVRAGQLSLSIAITYGSGLPSYDRPYATFCAFVHVAAYYAHRWSKIYISACSRSTFKSAFTCVTDALKARDATLPLRVASVSLRVISESSGYFEYASSTQLGYEYTWPFQAQEVILSGLPGVPVGCLTPSLECLELHHALRSTDSEYFDMTPVFRAPNVKTLVLDLCCESAFMEPKSLGESRRTLPFLQTLHTKGLHPFVLLPFLLRTAMPALRHVDITLSGTSDKVTTIINALLISGAPIEDLRIRRDLVYSDGIGASTPFLPGDTLFMATNNTTLCLPMLTRLSLENVQLRDDALMVLSAAMPRLATLHLCMEEDVTIDGLRELVLEQRRQESHLTEIQCLEIICCPHFDDAENWTDIVELVPKVVWLKDEDEDEEHSDHEDYEESGTESETDSEIDAVLDDEERAFLNL